MKVYGLDSSAAKSHYQAMLNATGVQQVTGLRVLIPENDSVANEQYFGYLSQVIQRELNLYLPLKRLTKKTLNPGWPAVIMTWPSSP